MLRFKCLACGAVKRVQNSAKVILFYRLRKNPRISNLSELRLLFPQWKHLKMKTGYLGYCKHCR